MDPAGFIVLVAAALKPPSRDTVVRVAPPEAAAHAVSISASDVRTEAPCVPKKRFTSN